MHADPASDFASLAEYRRLATLLESLPTTEAEDQLLLDSTLVTGRRAAACLPAAAGHLHTPQACSVLDAILAAIAADWRERTILEFRIMRKRALRQALAKLGVALQAGRASQPEHKAEL